MDTRKPARIVNATGAGKEGVGAQPWRLRAQAWAAKLTLPNRSRLDTGHSRYPFCLLRIKSALALMCGQRKIRLTVCCVPAGELDAEPFVSERWRDESLKDNIKLASR
jgi:hypothetical protein